MHNRKEYIRLNEAQFQSLIYEATVNALIEEGFLDKAKTIGKYGALSALGAAGVAGMDLANSELHDDYEDPMEANVREYTQEFNYNELKDMVDKGVISYEEAMELYNNK